MMAFRHTHGWVLVLFILMMLSCGLHSQLLSGPVPDSQGLLRMAIAPPPETAEIPLRLLNGSDFQTILLVGLGAYLVAKWDGAIDEEYALEDHQFPFQLLKVYGRVGKLYDSHYTYYTLGALGIYAVLRHREGAPRGGTIELMLKSLAISTVITTVVKTTIGRHRPYANNGPYEAEILDFRIKSSMLSFPSGHTASAFALMTVIAKRSGTRWVSIPAYTFAASVGFQRMLDRKHWASDVIAGGLVGYLVANWVVNREQREHRAVVFSPYSNGRQVGFSIRF